MLKKINDIFRLKGIFDFSHLQFDTIRAQSDGSGMEGKKSWSSGAEVRWTFPVAHRGLRSFLIARREFSLIQCMDPEEAAWFMRDSASQTIFNHER